MSWGTRKSNAETKGGGGEKLDFRVGSSAKVKSRTRYFQNSNLKLMNASYSGIVQLRR